MMYRSLEPTFVEFLPDVLEGGLLYVSMEHGMVAHSCCCGCGSPVYTPLTPTDWKIMYNGETITLSPSVGSWELPCRSHYIIKANRVVVAGSWTDEQIVRERQRDANAKKRHYKTAVKKVERTPQNEPSSELTTSWWKRAWARFRSILPW